jgi:hypothetical protein
MRALVGSVSAITSSASLRRLNTGMAKSTRFCSVSAGSRTISGAVSPRSGRLIPIPNTVLKIEKENDTTCDSDLTVGRVSVSCDGPMGTRKDERHYVREPVPDGPMIRPSRRSNARTVPPVTRKVTEQPNTSTPNTEALCHRHRAAVSRLGAG